MPTEKRQPPASLLQQFGNLRLPGSGGRPGNTGIGGGVPGNMSLSSMSMPSGPRRAPLAPVGPSATPAPALPPMPGMMLPPGTPGFFDGMRKPGDAPAAGPAPSTPVPNPVGDMPIPAGGRVIDQGMTDAQVARRNDLEGRPPQQNLTGPVSTGNQYLARTRGIRDRYLAGLEDSPGGMLPPELMPPRL